VHRQNSHTSPPRGVELSSTLDRLSVILAAFPPDRSLHQSDTASAMSARRSTIREAGFTLVEALIALLLVAGVAAGTSYLLVVSAGAMRDARDEASATLLAVQRLEQIASAVDAGAAVAASPDNALEVDAPGFSDRVDAAGNPESGAGPSSATVFVRRWRVVPLGAPAGAWTIQVRVLLPRVAAGGANIVADGGARSPGDVLLMSTRRRP
jgi:type II secretory pathway pseudopilin PulG